MRGLMSPIAVACVLAVLATAGCNTDAGAGRRELTGLTAVTYNYSDEEIVSVRVNGRLAGAGHDAMRPGDVTGGARMCCIDIDASTSMLPVEIKPALKDPFIVLAMLEHPITKYPHYAVVHVLPHRKVVVAVTPTAPAPRADLLDMRLGELGVDHEVRFPRHMMDGGPTYDRE